MFRAYGVWLVFGLTSLGFVQSNNNPPPSNPPAASQSLLSHDQDQAAAPSVQPVVTTVVSGVAEGASIRPPTSALQEALLFYRKGNFNAALEEYEHVLKEHPQSPDAYAGEVRIYLKMKKVEQAAAVAEKGLAASNSPRVR